MTMDPDEALAQMREAMETMSKDVDRVGPEQFTLAALALAEAACALDTWMANGGFLPAGWMLHRRAV
jgi:hypothetical protein